MHKIAASLSLFFILLSVVSTAQQKNEVTVLIGMRIINGKGDSVINKGVIIIKNGLIEAVGDSSLPIPLKAKIINLSGKTVMPGMVDMHAHFWSNGKQQYQPYSNLYLASGVTTTFSLGEYKPDSLDFFRQRINSGKTTGPRIYSAALYVQSGTPNALMQAVNTKDSAILLFNKYKKYLDGVKIYDNVNTEVFTTIMQLAKENNMIVTGHLGGSITTQFAIDKGINGLEHGMWTISELNPKTKGISPYCQIAEVNINSPLADSIIQKIVTSKVYVTGTFAAMMSSSNSFHGMEPNWKIYLEDSTRLKYRSYKSRNQACLDSIVVLQKLFLKKLFDRGALIVVGTDPVFPELMGGFSMQFELKKYTEAGIPNLEAIKMATYNGAVALRKQHLFGSIEKGKLADLVVIAGNPDKDINDMANVVLVMKEGKMYDPVALKKATIGSIQFRR